VRHDTWQVTKAEQSPVAGLSADPASHLQLLSGCKVASGLQLEQELAERGEEHVRHVLWQAWHVPGTKPAGRVVGVTIAADCGQVHEFVKEIKFAPGWHWMQLVAAGPVHFEHE